MVTVRTRTSSAAADQSSGATGSVPRAAVLSLVVVAILLGLPAGIGSQSASAYGVLASPSTPASLSHAPSHVTVASATPSPAAPAPSAFNPPCYKIDVGVCVSMCNQTDSNIIPSLGSFVSNIQPNSTSDLTLCIKSQTRLDWGANTPHSGQKSPLLLNVSAVLWNGDPFYSLYDGDYWHSNNPSNVWTGPTNVSSNKSGYIWWYQTVISAKGSSGVKNFFPGETVTWWLEITYNISYNYIHHESPHFQFTYSGAWPYSPYPGAAQYAGGSATFQDVNLTVTPRSPNWNDAMTFVLNTTQADAITNATIGNAYIDLTETAPTGPVIQTGTYSFPVQLQGTFGNTTTTVIVPPSYAQVEGATVTYSLTIYDTAADQLTTPLASYQVGGNGSFLSGIFVDDLFIQSPPPTSNVIASGLGQVMLPPGQPVNLTVSSRNTGTAISSAEIVESVSFPLLHEVVQVTIPMHRVSSTIFVGVIPGVPITSFVNFTVYAWDFTQRLEVSPIFGYYTPDFLTFAPVVDPNSTFFYVFVYDNGSKTWVDHAIVQITGPHSFFNSVGNTTLGYTYPNQTRHPYLPLLLPANTSYTISVNDPWFVPPDSLAGALVTVSVLGLHTMTNRQTLAQGSDYTVVQEANAVVFWLNTTPATAPISPQVSGGSLGAVPIGGFVGMVGVGLAAIPLARWWQQIRARRKAEEKRVTL